MTGMHIFSHRNKKVIRWIKILDTNRARDKAERHYLIKDTYFLTRKHPLYSYKSS